MNSWLKESARPPTTLVDTASSSPRNSAPPSPMMMRAGLKLCGRNPTHTPTAMMASSGPMLRTSSRSLSVSSWL